MKCLIIDHNTTLIEELKQLFPEADIVKYSEFHKNITEKYDFIVLSGGPIHISSPDDIKEEKEFLQTTTKPILGICLGLQIIGIAHGSALLDLEKERTGLFELEILGEKGKIHQEHGCFIKDVPDGFEVLDRQGDIIEAMAHKSRPILAIQGHPEKSGKFGELIKKIFIKKFVQPTN